MSPFTGTVPTIMPMARKTNQPHTELARRGLIIAALALPSRRIEPLGFRV